MIGDENDLNDLSKTFVKNGWVWMPYCISRSCNGMKKWRDSNSVYLKGTPMHVKGALIYNHPLKVKKLSSKYPEIMDGEKIKFVHLKDPNPYQCNAFTFLLIVQRVDINKYIDYEKQFEKSC